MLTTDEPHPPLGQPTLPATLTLVDEVGAIAGLSEPVEIGRGANAVVFRAWQPRLERHVAVKVLKESVVGSADEPVVRGRFQREVKALATLSWHPNIVTLLDAGTTPGGHPYLITSLLPGGTLHDRLADNGPLPTAEVAAIADQVLDAMGAAHQAGILHRDVKPSNILLGASGQAELADFGIASLGTRDLTRTGWFLGALSYTAPEVMVGERPTTASDVWSLAATLVTLLTGSAPWPDTGDGPAGLVDRIRTAPPPDLSGLGLPSAAATALTAALASEPAGRPTVAELRRALSPVPSQTRTTEDTTGSAPTVATPAIWLDKATPPAGGDHTRMDSTSLLPAPVVPAPPPAWVPTPAVLATSAAPAAPPAYVDPWARPATPQAWPVSPPAAPPSAYAVPAPAYSPHQTSSLPPHHTAAQAPTRGVSPLRVGAVTLVLAGAAVLALSTAVPWLGNTPLASDRALQPAGMLVLMVAAQWLVLGSTAARRSARACFVGLLGVLSIAMAASATRTSADISADPFSPPGIALASIGAALAGTGFLLLAATAGRHRTPGWRSPTPWLRTIAVWFWTMGVFVGLAGSPWFGQIVGGEWQVDVVWFRSGAPWVPLVAVAGIQLLVLARPFSHSRWVGPLVGAGTAAVIAVGTGIDTMGRVAGFDPLEESPLILTLAITTLGATMAALCSLSMLTFEAGRPNPPPRPAVGNRRGPLS